MRKETSPEELELLGDDAQRHEELLDLIEGEVERTRPIHPVYTGSRYQDLTLSDSITNTQVLLKELIGLREAYGLPNDGSKYVPGEN